MPIASIAHYFIALTLFGHLFAWGESINPPSPWITTALGILFTIMAPLIHVVGVFDRSIARLPDFVYVPFSLALSAGLWWSTIIWIITTRGLKASETIR